jgi:DNA-binding NtrC family response regulator
VVQERRVVRVGGERELEVKVRLVCATNLDLKARVGEGAFREDLYYRINVIHLHIPPLRERRDDIPWFAQRFLDNYLRDHSDESTRRLDHSAIQALLDHAWPGNVRELKNCIERACILSQQESLTGASLLQFDEDASPIDNQLTEKLSERMRIAEREFILGALVNHEWHIIETADALGISRKNLWEKMKKLDLQPPRTG